MNSDYFDYLRKRGRASIFLRRLFLKSVVNYFKGNVLDIGAGISEFLEYYPNATGIDINEDCVKFCAAKGLKCVHADVYKLPFDDDSLMEFC